MSQTSTIEPTIKRKDAAIGAIFSLLISLVVFIPFSLIWIYFCSAFFLVLFVIFTCALVFPSRFRRGISIIDGGFIYFSPIGGAQSILFADIQKIEAISRGDGGQGGDVPFLIHSSTGKVLVLEGDLLRTDLLKKLEALAGFDEAAYSQALGHEPKWLDLIFGKRFDVYENRTA